MECDRSERKYRRVKFCDDSPWDKNNNGKIKFVGDVDEIVQDGQVMKEDIGVDDEDSRTVDDGWLRT